MAAKSLLSHIAGLKSGEELALDGEGGQYKVRYDSRQSYGDNNRPVAGAVTGGFTVTNPNGTSSYHEHGPYALTDAARRRGASPDSRTFAVSRAHDAVVGAMSHAKADRLFHDRRPK